MKFGGLSEKQFLNIKNELGKHSIPYEIGIDDEMMDSNKELAQNPLQYLNPSMAASSDVFSIIVDDDVLEKFDQTLVQKLNEYDLYWGEGPFDSDEQFEEIIPTKKLADRQMMRVFSKYQLLLFITGLAAWGIYLVWKFIYS